MTDEEMENFVFAVLPKKTAAKMQKELQDLVIKVFFLMLLQNCPFPKHYLELRCCLESKVYVNLSQTFWGIVKVASCYMPQ